MSATSRTYHTLRDRGHDRGRASPKTRLRKPGEGGDRSRPRPHPPARCHRRPVGLVDRKPRTGSQDVIAERGASCLVHRLARRLAPAHHATMCSIGAMREGRRAAVEDFSLEGQHTQCTTARKAVSRPEEERMSIFELQIKTSSFLASQLRAVQSRMICLPPAMVVGRRSIQVQQIEFGNNRIHHEIPGSFTVRPPNSGRRIWSMNFPG